MNLKCTARLISNNENINWKVCSWEKRLNDFTTANCTWIYKKLNDAHGVKWGYKKVICRDEKNVFKDAKLLQSNGSKNGTENKICQIEIVPVKKDKHEGTWHCHVSLCKPRGDQGCENPKGISNCTNCFARTRVVVRFNTNEK